MKNQQSLIDRIHIKVHALRMLPKYKPSVFEQELNRMIAEGYADDCKECEDKAQQLKYQPIKPQSSGIGSLFGI